MGAKASQNRQKIRSGAVQGALGGDLGTMLAAGWPKAQKWNKKTSKFAPFQAPKSRLGPVFLGLVHVLFFIVFSFVFTIWVGFRYPKPGFRLSFWIHFETSGPLGKQLKVLQWLSISKVRPLLT